MKDILVLIHDDVGQEARFRAALDVARALRGRLICLDVVMMHALPGDGCGADGGVMMLQLEQEQESANRKRLEQRLAAADVTWDWLDVTGFLEPCLERAAARTDLIVVNRALDRFPGPNMERVAAGLIAKAGKPILAVPDGAAGFPAAGRALVAWDGSPPASRALEAAVPLLCLAASVTLLEAEDGSIARPAEQARSALARHGIRGAVLRRAPEEGRDASDVIMAAARSGAYDYLVMGGFSHSRFLEALWGGVTRRMLIESPLPVLFAH